jgi:hypothetical protein
LASDTSLHINLSAVEGRNMRPTFVHVLTGLLLGTALAGLLNVPGQVVARQESIPPVRTPKVAKPKGEVVVRVSPKVEAALVAEHERRVRARLRPPKPPAVAPPVLIRSSFPVHTPVVSPPTPDPAPQAAPPPKPEPVAAKPKPKPPEPVKKVVLVQPPAAPPPTPPPPPPAADEDDDDQGDGHRGHHHRKRHERHSKSNGRKWSDDDRHDRGNHRDRDDDDDHDRPRDRNGHGDRHGGHRH